MPAGTKQIKGRIKSIKNTKKITKAMEMVSAAKMRKATQNVIKTRPYSALAWQIISKISGVKATHPLLKENKKNDKSMVILFSSDKGLCGGFNSQMFRRLKEFMGEHTECDFVIAGKKGELFAKREKITLLGTFENLTNKPAFVDIKPIAKMAMDRFIDGSYSKVYVAYTDFISTITQKPRVRQLLPIIQDKDLGEVGQSNNETIKHLNNDYLFEPSQVELLEILLPKIVETQIYQALLESVASEHSARMVAMKAATDSANEMVDELNFTFNQLRQAGITREISEISAGKAALE